MSGKTSELRILHRKAIYPDTYGGSLRTLNIARLSRGVFERTTVFSMDNHRDFNGEIDGIHLYQEKESLTLAERLHYYARAFTAKEFEIPYTRRAFVHPEESLFQIENPLIYPSLKKAKISRFILDEHNVNWETYGMLQPELRNRIYEKIAYRRDKENEKQALLHAAHVLCCSLREKEVLVNEVPDISDRISVIPNCVDFKNYNPQIEPESPVGKENRSRILFVGTLSYPPNADAVRLICHDIAPRMSDRYQFIIAGKNPPSLHTPPNVMFSGYVPDIIPVIDTADICIAPIRSGSGTRLKILEYMAMGKPVIATSKGAEGIDYTDGVNIIIEDTIQKYPEIIRQLMEDEKTRRDLGKAARDLISAHYDWELYRKPMERVYTHLSER